MRTIASARWILILSLTAGTGTFAIAEDAGQPSWSPKSAAAYLDQRADWWSTWPRAAKDRGTFCISCHTALPYALARPALHAALDEKEAGATEAKVLASVTKRVQEWAEVEPFYNDKTSGPHKTEQARGSESIFNALILVNRDARAPRDRKMSRNWTMSDDAQIAFDNMWALQISSGDAKGSWNWIDFNNRPFEAPDSHYYGASLAAVAVAMTPPSYRSSKEIREHIALLRDYLAKEYGNQSSINRVAALWASAKLASAGSPEILTAEERQSLLGDLWKTQQSDGGWSLSSLAGDWKRHDNTAQEAASDGYATGVVALALETAGIPRSETHLASALNWLEHHQEAQGSWPASSLNKQRDPESDIGRFMRDSATAYTVLALTQP